MTPTPWPPLPSVSASSDSTYTGVNPLTFQAPGPRERRGDRPAYLVHVYPTCPNTGHRYPLGANPTVIGRGEECAIRNTDTSVSRCHARIVRGADGRFRVADLGSTNGTFVNNASRRESFLADGDYLRVGNCIYRFLDGEDIESEYHEEIYRLTIRDGLTQVYNRRYFTEFLERELTRAVRHKRSLAVILLAIDHLATINADLGQLASDIALREFCTRIRSVVRADELLARSGAEQFAVVLPEADIAEARTTAERIRLLVARQPFAFNNRTYPLTVSAGVAILQPSEGPTVAALLGLADANLARAKTAGQNRVVVS